MKAMLMFAFLLSVWMLSFTLVTALEYCQEEPTELMNLIKMEINKHKPKWSSELDFFPGHDNVPMTISGEIEMKDACTLVLRQFKYFPHLEQTKLYGLNTNQPNASMLAFPISSSIIYSTSHPIEINIALNLDKSWRNFNQLRLFSETRKVVIASTELYSKHKPWMKSNLPHPIQKNHGIHTSPFKLIYFSIGFWLWMSGIGLSFFFFIP